MKKEYIAFILLCLTLVSCMVGLWFVAAPESVESVPADGFYDLGNGLFRVEDSELGVACYKMRSVNSISCVNIQKEKQ